MEHQMKVRLKTVMPVVMLAAVMTVTTISCAPVANAQQYTFQSERAEHPNLAGALDALNAAYQDLQAAPSEFGGYKAEAMRDIVRAIHSTKRALYFRMRLDDAAIDRAR
jgi:hypothetical protein